MAPKKKISVSMSGCGFLGVYHVGVVSCFREFEDYFEIDRMAGASGGAIAAAMLLADCCIGKGMSDVLKLAAAARAGPIGPFSPRFDLVRSLRYGLLSLVPKDAHLKCNGRIGVSMTRCRDGQNVLMSQFEDSEDLVQALLCSSFVPIYSGLVPPYFRDGRYWDGGITNNMPTFDASTVTVSPFSGECDICPSDNSILSLMEINAGGQSFRINSHNVYRISRALFPPHPDILKEICEGGYRDCLRYVKRTLYAEAGPEKYIIYEAPEIIETPPAAENAEEKMEQEEPVEIRTLAMRPKRSNSVVKFLDKYTQNTVNLPGNVLDALREASAAAQHPLFRALSVAAIPWILPLEFMYSTCVRLIELSPKPRTMDINYYVDVFSSIAQRVVGQILSRHGSSWPGCNCQVEALTMSGSRCVIHGKANISDTHSLTFAFAVVEEPAPSSASTSLPNESAGTVGEMENTSMTDTFPLAIQASEPAKSQATTAAKMETALLTAAIRCNSDATPDTMDYAEACDIVESFERQVADHFREKIAHDCGDQSKLVQLEERSQICD